MDTYSLRIPLGVTAGITPFNFPATYPMWMFPMALVIGFFLNVFSRILEKKLNLFIIVAFLEYLLM